VSQIKGESKAKDHFFQKYLALAKETMPKFSYVEIEHTPRKQNTRGDILSKLAWDMLANINPSYKKF
jgi:hypothetical protein